MMNFQEFVEKIAEEFSYKISGMVHIVPVIKNNGVTLTGLTVTSEDTNISPTIYLDGYYEEYKQGKELCQVVEQVQEIYVANVVQEYVDISCFVEKEKMLKRLSLKLVNYETNKKLLAEIPHRRFLDMAVVYYYFLENEEHGVGTILIHNHHMRFWDMTEEEMFEYAYANYLNLHPAHVENMRELVISLLQVNEISVEDSRAAMEMLVVTNEDKLYGATMMLFPQVLKPIAEILGEDLYILPSSIHEILVLPKSGHMADELREMVAEVNYSEVTIEERLSDNVYCFSAKNGNVEIA